VVVSSRSPLASVWEWRPGGHHYGKWENGCMVWWNHHGPCPHRTAPRSGDLSGEGGIGRDPPDASLRRRALGRPGLQVQEVNPSALRRLHLGGTAPPFLRGRAAIEPPSLSGDLRVGRGAPHRRRRPSPNR